MPTFLSLPTELLELIITFAIDERINFYCTWQNAYVRAGRTAPLTRWLSRIYGINWTTLEIAMRIPERKINALAPRCEALEKELRWISLHDRSNYMSFYMSLDPSTLTKVEEMRKLNVVLPYLAAEVVHLRGMLVRKFGEAHVKPTIGGPGMGKLGDIGCFEGLGQVKKVEEFRLHLAEKKRGMRMVSEEQRCCSHFRLDQEAGGHGVPPQKPY